MSRSIRSEISSARRPKSRHRITPLVPKSVPSPQDPYLQEDETYAPIKLTTTPNTHSFAEKSTKSKVMKKTKNAATVSLTAPRTGNIMSSSESFFASLQSKGLKNERSYANDLPTTLSTTSLNTFKNSDQMRRIDSAVDMFLLKLQDKELGPAIEEFMQANVNASKVVFWAEIPSLQRLYSQKLDITLSHNDSIVGYAFFQRKILKIQNVGLHQAYSDRIDGDIINPKSTIILFPVLDSFNNIIGIVEIQKVFNDPIVSEFEDDIIRYFMKKFQVFAHWILQPPRNEHLFLDFLHLVNVEQFLLLFQRKMHLMFPSESAEIWEFTKKSDTAFQYKTDMREVGKRDFGIAGYVAEKCELFNCASARLQSSYCQLTDGYISAPVLAYPIKEEVSDKIYIVIIRGQDGKIFTTYHEKLISNITPFVITAFRNCKKFVEATKKTDEVDIYQEITKILPEGGKRSKASDIVINSMMSLEKITNADRSTFYILDNKAETLTSIYHSKLKFPIQQSYKHGIAGHVARTCQLHNSADAYCEVQFDASTDLTSGYKTKTILTVPIIDATGFPVAIIQLLNKKDSNPFTLVDATLARICGTICYCLMDNSVITTKFNYLSNHLGNYLSIMPHLFSGNDMLPTLNNVCEIIRGQKIQRVTIWTHDEAASMLVPLAFNGTRPPQQISMTKGVAVHCVKGNRPFLINKLDDDARVDQTFDVQIDGKINVAVAPILDIYNRPRGVLEIINKEDEISETDLKVLCIYSSVISLYIDHWRMQTKVTKGEILDVIDEWISPFERTEFKTPYKMAMNSEQSAIANGIDFFGPTWKDIETYQLIFSIFQHFELLEEFEITSEKFLVFLDEVRRTYFNNPYHSWKLVVDMLQFIYYCFVTTKMQYNLKPMEMLALCISCLFYFSHHDGTDDEYQRSIRSPIGVLFNSMSVLTADHCSHMINTMEKSSCNIFSTLGTEDQKNMWELVLYLMTTKEIESKISSLNMSNEEHRKLFLLLMLKCSSQAPFCRTFGINLKWQALMMEEMIQFGDKEMKHNLPFSNRNHSRDHHIKAQAQIEILENEALPIIEKTALLIPEMKFALTTANDNLMKWKERRVHL